MGQVAFHQMTGTKVVTGQFLQPLNASMPQEVTLPDLIGKKHFFLFAWANDKGYDIQGNISAIYYNADISSANAKVLLFHNSHQNFGKLATFNSALGRITVINDGGRFGNEMTYQYVAW